MALMAASSGVSWTVLSTGLINGVYMWKGQPSEQTYRRYHLFSSLLDKDFNFDSPYFYCPLIHRVILKDRNDTFTCGFSADFGFVAHFHILHIGIY